MKKSLFVLLLCIPVLVGAFTFPKEVGPVHQTSYKVILYHGPHFFVQYFQFTLPNKEIQKKLNDAIQKIVNDMFGGVPNEMAAAMKEPPKELAKYASYVLTSKVTFFGERYISILFNDNIFLSGAHPYGFLRTLNFDMKTGKVLKLSDLFSKDTDYITELSTIVKKDALSDVGQNFMDFKHIKSNQDFVFAANDTLILFFQEYEYTAYAAGRPKIYVDIEDLKGFKLKLNGLVMYLGY
jgi:hypothetical protein